MNRRCSHYKIFGTESAIVNLLSSYRLSLQGDPGPAHRHGPTKALGPPACKQTGCGVPGTSPVSGDVCIQFGQVGRLGLLVEKGAVE